MAVSDIPSNDRLKENTGKDMIKHSVNSTGNSYLITKRFIDILGSLIGIILLSPLLIIISLAIKIEDPKGPVFFKQKRVGLDGKVFYMYKFRSMVSNAEDLLHNLLELNETTGPIFKLKNDPRVTKIGKFIRKTSIDELPQLWNVLKGEMSLVGPRPALPREVDQYSSYDRQRLLSCSRMYRVMAG